MKAKPGVPPSEVEAANQKWQEEFGKKSLEMISQKWNDQLVRNKIEFDKGAEQLQKHELKLI